MSQLLRVYEPAELGSDGYPLAWHKDPHCDGSGWLCDSSGQPKSRCPDPTCGCDAMSGCPNCWAGGCGGEGSIKNLVRAIAGHRCVRCGHPFRVGVSGVMEGPSAHAKAFAAELGLSVEQLDLALSMVKADAPGKFPCDVLDKAPRVNWSPCDAQCTHSGPLRWQPYRDGRWIERIDAGEGGVAHLVAVGCEPQAAWRILTVHHLTGNKADCRWWNLAALCQRCHLEVQGKVNMAQVWPHEHSEWFKPYAAGFYAATYLGEELPREETMERLDELLGLERAA